MLEILFLASLREAMGCDSLQIQCPEDIDALYKVLAERYDKKQMNCLKDNSVLVAHNQKICKGNVRLQSGDELAFLPPITGG